MGVLVERYCQVTVSPFGPDATIIAIDGDSLRPEDRVEDRLFGFDAQGLRQSWTEVNGKPWQCGGAAKANGAPLINRAHVACETGAKDRYGGIVAVCSAEGVPDLAEAMVRDG